MLSKLRKLAIRILAQFLVEDDIVWIVDLHADLGVRVGNRHFALYKGKSMELKWRTTVREVEKREFGETCHPRFGFVHPYTYGEGWYSINLDKEPS